MAVDYLVYTNEVIGNISQSYPVALFLGGITVAAGVITLLARRWLSTVRTKAAASSRGFAGAALLVLCACSLNMVNFMDISEDTGDRYLTELSKDGLYSLFHAFFSNELSYNDFYLTRPDADTVATLAPLSAFDARRYDPARRWLARRRRMKRKSGRMWSLCSWRAWDRNFSANSATMGKS